MEDDLQRILLDIERSVSELKERVHDACTDTVHPEFRALAAQALDHAALCIAATELALERLERPRESRRGRTSG